MGRALLISIVVIAAGTAAYGETTAPSRASTKMVAEEKFASGEYDGQFRGRACGYYIYACRAWWAGCRWEGPFSFPLNRYWGYRYLCW